MNFITQKSLNRRTVRGHRRHDRAAVPYYGAGRRSPRCGVRLAMEMVHARPAAPRWRHQEFVGAGGDRIGIRLEPDRADPARALARIHHHRQQHRRAERRGVSAARNRRRSLPLGRGVPDAVASETDAGLGFALGHIARSAVRAEVRTGNADALDAALRRERRSGRRLLLRYSCAYTDSISWATPKSRCR